MKKFIAFLMCLVCTADISFAMAASMSPSVKEVSAKKIVKEEVIVPIDVVEIDLTKLEVINDSPVYVYESSNVELAFDATTADEKIAAAIDAVYDEENKHWLIVFMEVYTEDNMIYLKVYKNN